MLAVVLQICAKFKDLIENNALSQLLYDGTKPKHESAAQLAFYGIADSYCEANNLDLTREANAGRGPVDFRVSGGYHSRVTVEAKLTTNNQLIHGFQTQLAEYQKAEKAGASVYIVIDVGGPRARLLKLRKLIADSKGQGRRIPEVVFVDARPKAPASKYRPDVAG